MQGAKRENERLQRDVEEIASTNNMLMDAARQAQVHVKKLQQPTSTVGAADGVAAKKLEETKTQLDKANKALEALRKERRLESANRDKTLESMSKSRREEELRDQLRRTEQERDTDQEAPLYLQIASNADTAENSCGHRVE